MQKSTDKYDVIIIGVVTVSIGVLQHGAIIFSPPLSQQKQRALEHLGLGNLHKVYLEFPSEFWDETQIIHIVTMDGGGQEFISLTKEMKVRFYWCFTGEFWLQKNVGETNRTVNVCSFKKRLPGCGKARENNFISVGEASLYFG